MGFGAGRTGAGRVLFGERVGVHVWGRILTGNREYAACFWGLFRQVPEGTGSMHTLACEVWESLAAKFGEVCQVPGRHPAKVPKLLALLLHTKNDSKIIIFEKLRISLVIP